LVFFKTTVGIFQESDMILNKYVIQSLLFPLLAEGLAGIMGCKTVKPLETTQSAQAIQTAQATQTIPITQDKNEYLSDIQAELKKEWPKNRTINIVFHGHSVPSGYARTPLVKTFDSYPYLFLEKLKAEYPYAVVNIIVTAKGGENAESGAARFKRDVLTHKPDVLLIDYALNDFGLGLERSYKAWNKMIKLAKKQHIKIILLTPSPDLRVNLSDSTNSLKQHADQIVALAKENNIGLADPFEVFSTLYRRGDSLENYMAQVNHPNRAGNQLIADEIMKWFR
jgi:acyl-CoA thioesterase-1